MNIGKIGEIISKNYLIEKGFKIITTNFHSCYGEIDIICDNFEYIVFAEVKTKLKNTKTIASERVDIHKQNKILKTIGVYLCNNTIIKQPRIDVIEVILTERNFKINHIENAFGVCG